MDHNAFDSIVRSLAGRPTRRTLGATVAGVIASLTSATGDASAAKCLKTGKRCTRNSGGRGDHCRRCCSGYAKRRGAGGGRCACKPAGRACAANRQCCNQSCTGGVCAVPTCANGGACRVFVSAAFVNGALGGLDGADALCQGWAAAAGLSGTFKAWLSTSSASPSTRFTPGTGSYVLVDGTAVANSWADLLDGELAAPINWTELDEALVGPQQATTATASDGTLVVDEAVTSCGDWQVADSSLTGGGYTTNTNSRWTEAYGGLSCATPAHLYCFEQGA